MVGSDDNLPSDGLLPEQWETAAIPAERRQLTVVFVDIIESTSLSARLDPDEFFALLSAYHTICAKRIRSYGGSLARVVGDGVLAYFGLPIAHEDDCERAVHAALSITEVMQQQRFQMREAGLLQLRVRVSVNTGLVVVGRMGGEPDFKRREVFGLPVHIAARLQNIAPPNSIVIGASSYELVRKAFRCTYLDQYNFKGLIEPVRAWVVDGAVESESRFSKTRGIPLSPMVGRTFEHAKLMTAWTRASSGRGGLVLVSGEAGIGKSRLIYEFREALPTNSVEILYLQCSPLQANTPLAPEIDRLKRAAGLTDSDTPSQMVSKLRNLLAVALPDVEDALRYYGALLSIEACGEYAPADLTSPREREQALQTLIQVLVALSRSRPVLLILEDAQWVDPTSLNLLERLISCIASERILVVVTHRTDIESKLLARDSAITIPLTKLSTTEAEQLIRRIARNKQLPGWALNKIVDRTDGVPLFVEEVTRTISESGLLQTGQDRTHVETELSELLLPSSILDFLTERLDSLGRAKRIAQVASVLGREFALGGLRHLSDLSDDALLEGLSRLQAAGVLKEQARSESAFAFRHVMIQEAAYSSLVKEERRDLHARAASWLSNLGSNRESAQLAVLGHHYSRAGMPSDAIRTWLSAGQAAMQRSAYKEVIANLSEGLRLVPNLPDSPERSRIEMTLHTHLAMAYGALGGWSHPRADHSYGRAFELSNTHGSVREKTIVLWGMTIGTLVNSNLPKALEHANELKKLAKASGDDETAVMAHAALLNANFFLGRLTEARNSARFVTEQYDPAVHSKFVQIYQHDPNIVALVHLGRTEWLLGHPNEARRCCQEARRFARKVNHPFMLAFALILGAFDYLCDGDHAATLACVEEGIEIAKQYTLPLFEVFGPLWAISAFASRDPTHAILNELNKKLLMLTDNKYFLQASVYQSHLAIEFHRAGAVAEAHGLARAAEETLKRTGERWFEPEVYRIRASLLSHDPQPDIPGAMAYLGRALESARALHAVGWELRAATDLANLAATQEGEIEEALNLLAHTRGKFAAHDSSADLREADATLQRLRGMRRVI
jgi:class 3 adenylate cyclase/predicted ATPase